MGWVQNVTADCPKCGGHINYPYKSCPNCIPECVGKCQPETEKCKNECPHRKVCWAQTWPRTIWVSEYTKINLFDVNEAQIQRIMLDLRQMPKGLHHFWTLHNPNADESRQWASISIYAERPIALTLTLNSRRLKYPNDPLCGEQHYERRFVNLTKFENYLRREVRSLQRQWASNWPQGNREMGRLRREYLWEHS